MTHFSNQDYDKHDYLYLNKVIDDLIAGRKVKIFKDYVTKIGDSIDKSDFDIDQLNAIAADTKQSTVEQFNKAFNRDDKSIFTKIDKSPYSGRNGQAVGGAKTVLQEVGFAVCFDAIANGKDNIEDYKINDNVVAKNQHEIEQAIEFLKQDKSWLNANLEGAKALVEYLRENNINPQNYEIHRGSPLFDQIKKVGSKLTEMTADKWNPADVLLIKKGVTVNPTGFKNYIDYNQYIGANKDVIGVSLKKGDHEALHGAFALGQLVKLLKLGSEGFKEFNNVDECKPALIDYLNQLQHSVIADDVYIYTNKADSGKTITELVNQMKPNSSAFSKSFPPALQFLISVRNNREKMIDAVTAAYLVANSTHSTSCPFIKVSGSSVKQINSQNADTVKVNRILIPLTGDIHVLFDVTVTSIDETKTNIKLQLRSKGSAPQFIILKEDISTKIGTKIAQFKLS